MQGVHLHSCHDKGAAALYARNAMLLHVGCVTCDWDRYILPPAHVLSEDQSLVRCPWTTLVGLQHVSPPVSYMPGHA